MDRKLGICFWRLAIESAFGPDRPAGRSLLDRRSFSEGGGKDWRPGKGGVKNRDFENPF